MRRVTGKALAQAVYQSAQWKQLRSIFLDGKKCEICNLEIATQLHHKITPFRYPQKPDLVLAYDRENLQPLCRTCHTQVHKEMRMKTSDRCPACGFSLEDDFCV